jgi:hypothetical protein
MMNLDSQIVEIIRVLSSTKNALLISRVMELVEEAKKNEIVGYEPDGTPITQDALVQSLKQAESDIKEGNTWKGSELIAHFKDQSKHG